MSKAGRPYRKRKRYEKRMDKMRLLMDTYLILQMRVQQRMNEPIPEGKMLLLPSPLTHTK